MLWESLIFARLRWFIWALYASLLLPFLRRRDLWEFTSRNGDILELSFRAIPANPFIAVRKSIFERQTTPACSSQQRDTERLTGGYTSA